MTHKNYRKCPLYKSFSKTQPDSLTYLTLTASVPWLLSALLALQPNWPTKPYKRVIRPFTKDMCRRLIENMKQARRKFIDLLYEKYSFLSTSQDVSLFFLIYVQCPVYFLDYASPHFFSWGKLLAKKIFNHKCPSHGAQPWLHIDKILMSLVWGTAWASGYFRAHRQL